MWKLIKAEIAYRAEIFLLIFLSSILVLFVLIAHYKKNWPGKNIAFIFLGYMFFCILITVVFNPWRKEQRNRRLIPLPVSIRQIGTARITVEIIYWLALTALFFIYAFISKTFSVNINSLLALMAQTGLVLIGYSLACFFLDRVSDTDTGGPNRFDSIIEKILRSTLKFLLPAQIFLLTVIQLIGIKNCYFENKDIYYRIFRTLTGASILFFPGLILLILSIYVFEHRKSYIE
jgi:hypothetical protein